MNEEAGFRSEETGSGGEGNGRDTRAEWYAEGVRGIDRLPRGDWGSQVMPMGPEKLGFSSLR